MRRELLCSLGRVRVGGPDENGTSATRRRLHPERPGRAGGRAGRPQRRREINPVATGCGLISPTSGTVTVLGEPPASGPEQLAKVGFVAQDAPTYATLTVADHLRLGARLNPGWDARLADDRIRRLGIDLAQRAGALSGGQRAQLALTLGVAKRPELSRWPPSTRWRDASSCAA
ncbi:ABC transporter ATP-binding protein [Streptomyces chrestomyceticus JCM 4735]|uniref:ABC transporter ATP-binding protein n=1 Tax=Streptomyces chrestomyceticus JCM 4735 TaxID=1306181 RepID=A0A7U9Q1G5_9ACTN|nr:ABC transporter ATP-binding protein [Streptomyces chrestomyceticus JCM 4735]